MTIEPATRPAPIVGELVDADHDGVPDTAHAAPGAAVVGPILNGELVDTPQPVDKPHAERDGMAAVLAYRTAKRRPVIAPWIVDGKQRAEVARWAAGHVGHIAAFHAARTPIYAARLTWRSPVGLVKLAAAGGAWLLDVESQRVREQAAQRDSAMWLRLREESRQTRKPRMIVASILAALATAGIVVVHLLAPTWVAWSLVVSGIGVFGMVGATKDKPIKSPAVVPTAYERLTSDSVTKALGALGISEINKALGKGGAGITFPSPIHRDGPGWRAEVDLPLGVTATNIIDKRAELASGLRRPLGCVWPEGDVEQHAGRVVIFCGDTDLRKSRQPAWPLLKQGQADLFKPIPFGTDVRGRPVGLDLMFANLLLGAMPRQGKTASMRLVCLAAALDVTCQLRIFELKGTGDLQPLEPVCHHYGSGADDDTIESALQSLRDLYNELITRAATLQRLAKTNRALVPDNKVTPEVAANRKLGLFPILAGIDECQELFTHEKHGKEAAALCTAIIKRGPALGIMLVLATQRPDKDSLPKAISANVAIRFCLYVAGWQENDMVLGTSKYQQGTRATDFTPMLDAGIGMLVGADAEDKVVRTYYLNGPKAEKVAERARALRQAAGTLTGHAIGQAPEQGPKVSVLQDAATVFIEGGERMWSETIVRGLADLRPEFYQGWTPAQLAAALKPYGLASKQIEMLDADGERRNRNGFEQAAILAALEADSRPRELDD